VIDPHHLIGTAELSLPFKLLKDISSGKNKLVDMPCEYWNQFNSHILEWGRELLALVA